MKKTRKELQSEIKRLERKLNEHAKETLLHTSKGKLKEIIRGLRAQIKQLNEDQELYEKTLNAALHDKAVLAIENHKLKEGKQNGN